MIKTTAMLLEELKTYASPKTKLSRMVAQGKLTQVTRGIYETDRNAAAYLLAGSIYGPSYISFDYALAKYGLIPEAVYTITSATFEKKKKKLYETPFGTFSYRDVPPSAFPLGQELLREEDRWYRIAVPEKALCDKLFTLPPVANQKELQALLLDDLRIDETGLLALNEGLISEFSGLYGSTNVTRFAKLLRRWKNESRN